MPKNRCKDFVKMGLVSLIFLEMTASTAFAGCQTVIGYGSSTVKLTAADQARNSFARQVRSRFGLGGGFRKISRSLRNMRFSCHTGRRNGRTIFYCSQRGSYCVFERERNNRRILTGPLRPR